MNGLSFLQAGALAALAGLAVPVILHLMNREVPRPIVFPTIRFILQGSRPQQGRRGLRDLLTLLMRLALFALMVLLFAQPVLQHALAPAADRDGRLVLVYDVSPSMGRTDWRAFFKAETARVLAERKPVEVAAIATADGIVAELTPTADTAALDAFLASLALSNRPGSHAPALTRAASWMSGAADELAVFSDGQRQDWSASVLPPLAVAGAVEFITPTNLPAQNLAIRSVASENFGDDGSRRLRAVVQVRNFGLEPKSSRLHLAVGDREITRDIEVRGDYTEKFVLDMEGVTGTKAVATLDSADAYPADDVWHFWIGPRPAFRVGALVDSAVNRNAVDLLFLRTALETSLPGMPKFDTSAMEAGSIGEKDLASFHALALFDSVRDYTEVEMGLLKTYVNEGGVLLIFCADLAPECLVNLNKNKLSGVRYVGKSGDASRQKAWTLSQMDRTAPALEAFGDETSDLLNFPIYQICRLNAPADATVLLSVDDTMPFLIQENMGAGQVYTFATPLDPSWSDLPTSLSFLPLLRQLLERNRSDNFGVASVEIGADPGPEIRQLGGDPEGFAPTEAGVYVAGSIPVEYNFTREESDQGTEDSYAVRRRLGTTDRAPAAAEDSAETAGGPLQALSPLLAWLLLGALFGELIAANWRAKSPEQTT